MEMSLRIPYRSLATSPNRKYLMLPYPNTVLSKNRTEKRRLSVTGRSASIETLQESKNKRKYARFLIFTQESNWPSGLSVDRPIR